MTITSQRAGFGVVEEGPHRLVSFVSKVSSPLQGGISPFFSFFFVFAHICLFTEVFTIFFLQFVSKGCCVNAVRYAMSIPLLLMQFSFGEGMALSLKWFLLSLVPEMDHPQLCWLAAFADPYFNGLSSVCLLFIWEKWL